MRYIYIAGPYSKGDPVINTANAIRAADHLASYGIIPFVPHLTLFWHLLSPHEIEFWYNYDIAWLSKCDGLLRLSGESPGADNEVRIAEEKGIKIYYTMSDLIDARMYEVT
jgi:hypothetical protein